MRLDIQKAETYCAAWSNAYCEDFFENKLYITDEHLHSLSNNRQLNLFVYFSLYTQWIKELQKIRSPYFDYEAAPVQESLAKFMNILSHHVQINRAFFEPLLKRSLFDMLYFLFEPHAFMHKLIERGSISGDRSEWLRCKKFFHLHTSTMDLVYEDLQLEGEDILTKDRLHQIIDKQLSRFKPAIEHIETQLESIAFIRPVNISLLTSEYSAL